MEVAMVRLMPTSLYSILSESSSVHPGVQVKCRDARILRQNLTFCTCNLQIRCSIFC